MQKKTKVMDHYEALDMMFNDFNYVSFQPNFQNNSFISMLGIYHFGIGFLDKILNTRQTINDYHFS